MSHSEDILIRQTHLSPERRALLELWKRGQQVEVADTQKIVPRREKSPVPLSFEQQRLWFLDQLEPGNPFYNVYMALSLSGPLNVKALQQSLDVLVQRHESLRTAFDIKDGQPVQVIEPLCRCILTIVELSVLRPLLRQEEIQRLAREDARIPFDLVHSPLCRATLVRVDKNNDEHVLLLTMHHIITDGWSTGILMRELAICYNAFIVDQVPSLPDLPIQYADYALWQRQRLQGEELAKQRRYWQGRLAGMSGTLELPTDYPRPTVQHYDGALEIVQLPLLLSEALQRFSEREGVTLFTTLLAAFQVLLARYTGQDDIVIGTDSTNRSSVETEGVIGFFVNNLVIRGNLSGNPTFREFLKRMQEATLEDFAHRDMPFDVLVADLQPDRHLSRSTLVQVMFSLQDTSITEVPLTNIKLTRLFVDAGVAKFDLLFDLIKTEHGLSGSIEYNTELFEKETIRRFFTHWQTLLECIVSHPEQRVKELPILTAVERHRALVEWNSSTNSYPTDNSVQTLFEAQVALTPERVAVTYQGGHLTYAELNERANQLAHHLRELGIGPELLVGIYLERSLEMLVGILAIFKAGGAYVPLDLAYPKERLEIVLNETQVSAILSTSAWHILLSSITTTPVVCLDTSWQLLSRYSKHNPPILSRHNNLAYVIYTSGSTGRPKGAMLSQEGMINHLYAKLEVLECSRNDRVAQTASLCFDISTWQFLTVLLQGGLVCVFSDEDVYNPLRLAKQTIIEGISILELVPAQLRMLLDGLESIEATEPYLSQMMSLRRLISTGEALSPGFCRRWLQRYPQVPLVNTYGATECSDDVTHALVRQMPPEQSINVAIGRPIASMQVYVLDDSFAPVPIGVTGQIYIGGLGVGRGYLKDAARTAAVFLPDPYGKEAGERLYQTGDLGRYLPDGQIECLGRVDYQVKVHGHRVELGEIEVVLEQHPSVHECAVLDWEEQPGDKRLAAYIVAKELQEAPSAGDLRGYLLEKLPDYMVPSYFVLLEALPLTPNGKVDRRALPVPDHVRPELDSTFVAPRSLAEEVVASVWTDFLKVDRVGIYDNFFAIGGHSLLATQIVLRLQDIFQVELPLRRFFEVATIAGIVNEITQLRGGRDIVEEIAQVFKEIEQLSDEEVMELAD